MKEHYRFTDEEFSLLEKDGITVADLYTAVKLFDPQKNELEIGIIGLLHYVDSQGDFFQSDKPHAKIAKAVFNKLGTDVKMMVVEYIEDMSVA